MDAVIRDAIHDLADVLGCSDDFARIAVGSLFLALLVVIYLVLGRTFGGRKADTIAIVGLCGAGKTSLFHQLRDGSLHNGTVTSMEANEGRFSFASELIKNPRARPVHVIDVPGHPRLRSKVEEVLPQCTAVIFLVDALDFMPNLRATAELLYEVLYFYESRRQRVPVLMACNKMDKVSAHSVDFIRKQLEKELEKIRHTQKGMSGLDDSAKTSKKILGLEGEPFKFTHCKCKVTTTECSVLNGKVADLESFIRDRVRA